MSRNNSVKYIPTLKKVYMERVIPEMKKKYNYKNDLQVPKLHKIVINIGVSEAKDNIKVLEIASNELAQITGQKPKITRAKKSIAGFKLKKNTPIGLKVTLRKNRLYEFLHRLIWCALPRIRDFRGLNPNSFDGNGNYNLGLQEQYIFPEVDISKSDKPRGMNITFVTTTNNNEQAYTLLSLLGMPFRAV